MLPGTGRALIFIALLGLSMVPFIVAPPEIFHEPKESKDGAGIDYDGEKSTELYGDVTENIMELKLGVYELEEFRKALGNMSRVEQFKVSPTASEEQTERLLAEAANIIKHIKSCDANYWLEAYLVFLEKLFIISHPERFIMKQREELIENTRDSSITKENLVLDNISRVQQSETGHTVSELPTVGLLVEAEDMIKYLRPSNRRYWLEEFVLFLQNLHDKLANGKYNHRESYNLIKNKRDTSITNENSLSLGGSRVLDSSALATANLKPQESNSQTFASILPELKNVNVPTLPDKSKSAQNNKVTSTSLTENTKQNRHSSTIKSLETRNLEESRAIIESLRPNNAHEATANFKPQEIYSQTFGTILPKMENLNVPTLPDKSKSTQNYKVTSSFLTEAMDQNRYPSTIKSLETKNLEESRAIIESLRPNNANEATENLKSQQSYSQTFATILPVLENVNVPTLLDKSKSTQNEKKTSTSLTETPDRNRYPSTIKSMETRNLEKSISLRPNNAQEFHPIPASTETYIAHESKDKSALTEINILQEPQAKHIMKKITSPQEPRDMPEPSKALSKNQSLEHNLQIVKASNTQVPEVKQLFPILDNPNHSKHTRKEIVNNRVVLHDYFEELVKEILELARLEALKRSQNDSFRSTNESKSPSLTTVNRKSFKSTDENPEITTGKPLQISTIMPLSSKESLAVADETTPDHAVPETSHQQNVQLILEAQTTLPKREKAIQRSDNPKESTTITLAQNNEMREDDELVRELEELPMLAALERSASTSTPSINLIDRLVTENKVKSAQVVNSIDALTSPANVIKRRSFETDYQSTKGEEQIKWDKAHREILKQIYDSYHSADKKETLLSSLGMRNVKSLNESQHTKIGQEAEIRNVKNNNAYKTIIAPINPFPWKPLPSPYPLKPQINNSFEGMRINLSPMKERVITSRLPVWAPYTNRMITDQRNIRNMLHKLQNENYRLKTQLMSATQKNRNVNKLERTTFPESGHRNQFVPHETRYPTQISLGQGIQYRGGVTIQTPYPYLTKSYPKNFTLKAEGKTSTLVSNPINTTNSEFTDEMKRQLRDGKVILLSDSVVHSNFETGREKETTKFETEAGQSGTQAKN